ncbi:MAG TPA: hypothetical protein VHZ26_10025 [Caulobacteraceae bacterium]|jgi:hypothetical protein|nr:hypothetical protein [Caulobacteraceae bacterium]
MKRLTILGLAVVIAGSAAGASLAQDAPAGGGMRQACGADVAKLCPDAQPGPGRRQCVMAHKDQLSDACKTAIAAMMARHQAGQTPAGPAN